MDPEYGARYATLYRRHWWWRAREELLQRTLDAVVGKGGAGKCLDFGCGDGVFFPVLERYGEPYGIEPDVRLLDPNGPWRSRISTDMLRFEESETARYGLIVALDVLEHIADPLPVMQELVRRLRPGGWFVATVPAFQSLWTTHDDINHHERRYTAADFGALMRDAGLRVVDSRYFFTWLALAKWPLARIESLVKREPKPAGLPPAPINSAVLALSRLEQALVGKAHPWFGSSLLAISTNAPPSP